MSNTTEKYIYKIGRRKTSVATVRLFESKGESLVNNKQLDEAVSSDYDKSTLLKPFRVLDLDVKNFHFTARVIGGGVSSQIGAMVLGISRALASLDESYRKPLKSAGLLTRDPRMVERKKTGLHKARKREQYSKR